MVQFQYDQVTILGLEALAQKFTAQCRYFTLEKLKHGHRLLLYRVLADRATAFVLCLSFPKSNTVAVVVVHGHERVHDSAHALPAHLVPQVKLSEWDTIVQKVCLIHLQDGLVLFNAELVAVLFIVEDELGDGEVFFFLSSWRCLFTGSFLFCTHF